MRTALRFLGIVLLAACGGKVSTVPDPTDTPAATTTGTARPPRGGSSPTSQPDPVPQPPPPLPEKAEYSAQAWLGGLDHLEVTKADYATNTCTRVFLTNPASSKQFPNVSAPSDWAVTNAVRTSGVKGCAAGSPTKDGVPATDGKGTLAWKEDPGVYLPCNLSVHAVLLFATTPTQVTFDADDVAVKGCQ